MTHSNRRKAIVDRLSILQALYQMIYFDLVNPVMLLPTFPRMMGVLSKYHVNKNHMKRLNKYLSAEGLEDLV